MGHIVKKILGDVDKDPNYENLTIEDNEDGKIHIHLKNIRMDLTRDDWKNLKQAIFEAHDKMKKYHNWSE